jgi:hypothetical protein
VGDEEVEREDGEVAGKDAVGAAAVEVGDGRALIVKVRTEDLLADEEAAEDEEEVDAHPAVVGDGEDVDGEFAEDGEVVEHDDEDREGAEGVESAEADGGGSCCHGMVAETLS